MEIGGYFELERFYGKPYHSGLIALNSGRGCISYLSELRGIKTIWLPDWMCDSVSRRFLQEGIEVKTYQVGIDFLPIYNFDVASDEWLYLMDYYGQLKKGDVERAIAICDGRLVVDEAHGFFRKPWAGCDTTYTCRKWFGVSDGAYVATSDGSRLERELPVDESHERLGFVLGRFERPANEYFAESKENNEIFDSEPARCMSPLTENILSAVDYSRSASIRINNWIMLHGTLCEINELQIDTPDVPFMYPLLLDRAEEVRNELIKNKVYVPVLWPNVLEETPRDSVAHHYASSIIPLPVDQRYGEREMNYVLDVLRRLGVVVG